MQWREIKVFENFKKSQVTPPSSLSPPVNSTVVYYTQWNLNSKEVYRSSAKAFSVIHNRLIDLTSMSCGKFLGNAFSLLKDLFIRKTVNLETIYSSLLGASSLTWDYLEKITFPKGFVYILPQFPLIKLPPGNKTFFFVRVRIKAYTLQL